MWSNEIDPFAAAWQRQLMASNIVPPAEIDERSIEDVTPDQLSGFRQCHFFSGIGVWPFALRIAGWPENIVTWTGSCPCQPFSTAGKRAGAFDERHLWPAWHWLIEQCRPDIIFGEQVASADALAWIDLVSSDLDGAGYAIGVADTCAAGFGAPHIRQRLYWVAYAEGSGLKQQRRAPGSTDAARRSSDAKQPTERSRDARGMGHPERLGAGWDAGAGVGAEGGLALRPECDDARPSGSAGRLADAKRNRASARADASAEHQDQGGEGRRFGDEPRYDGLDGWSGPTNGLWANPDWLLCRDGRWRPVEPGTFPLAHRAPARVGRLRGYGNAIVAPQAVEFVRAAMDVLNIREAA